MGLKQINILLTILIFGWCCATGQKTANKKITVTVIDANNNEPIDSATVTLKILKSNGKDIWHEIKHTTGNGECRFSIEVGESDRYTIYTKKKGFFPYYNIEENGNLESLKDITRTTGNKMILLLTSDSLHQVNYWDSRTPHYQIDTLIQLLRTDNYKPGGWPAMPKLDWEDVPKLLGIGNDSTKITNFPRNGLSSYHQKDCYLGVVSLWLIESIRITEERKLFRPMERFPSGNARLREKDDPHLRHAPDSIETMEAAYHAYNTWWEAVKNMNKKDACKIDPLSETTLRW